METPYTSHTTTSSSGVYYIDPTPTGLFDMAFKDLPKPTKNHSIQTRSNYSSSPGGTYAKPARHSMLAQMSHPNSVTRTKSLRPTTDTNASSVKQGTPRKSVITSKTSTLSESKQVPWKIADMATVLKQHYLQQIEAMDCLVQQSPHKDTCSGPMPTLEQAFSVLRHTLPQWLKYSSLETSCSPHTQPQAQPQPAWVTENDELKKKVQQLQHSHVALEEHCHQLRVAQSQTQKALVHAKSAMVTAMEAQTKAEDEHERLRMEHAKIEWEVTDLRKTLADDKRTFGDIGKKGSEKRQRVEEALETVAALQTQVKALEDRNAELEQECMSLVDDLLAIENDQGSFAGQPSSSTERFKKHAESQHERYVALEKSCQLKLDGLQTQVADLEEQLEAKILAETHLETTLALERRRTDQWSDAVAHESAPLSPVSLTFSFKSSSSSSSASGLYCELCDLEGHDVLGCTALNSRTMYCENCDVCGFHSTKDCPHQDEMF
ncbi:hypothetical protein BDF14DRAFT_1879300 [Spinellus fusiger]|nr:hypothetical protein BDF14DRAFT_1879300 [Spinellus fusiger]